MIRWGCLFTGYRYKYIYYMQTITNGNSVEFDYKLPTYVYYINAIFLVGRIYCNATFDGVQCWNYTVAGSLTIGACPQNHPNSILFDNPAGKRSHVTDNNNPFRSHVTENTDQNRNLYINNDFYKIYIMIYLYGTKNQKDLLSVMID